MFPENWRNFSAHEQTVFRENYFAFRKDFSQWKSGIKVSLPRTMSFTIAFEFSSPSKFGNEEEYDRLSCSSNQEFKNQAIDKKQVVEMKEFQCK